MQQLKNINKIDKHIHTHKKRYLEVISRFTRFKEFNGEKNTATKTSNMFKIVPRIGMLVLALQNFARVVSLSLLNKLHSRIRDNKSQLYITALQHLLSR